MRSVSSRGRSADLLGAEPVAPLQHTAHDLEAKPAAAQAAKARALEANTPVIATARPIPVQQLLRSGFRSLFVNARFNHRGHPFLKAPDFGLIPITHLWNS
jgi:hypothetical protein